MINFYDETGFSFSWRRSVSRALAGFLLDSLN